MCGIAGIYNQTSGQPVMEQELAAMLHTMPHRGPDASGIWRGARGIGLAHVRLAIIDLRPESNQPFASSDGDIVMTYNGEIFNYLELRQELKDLGHQFRTNSDTEVLLTAYRQWGQDVCRRLNGMWAFAIYDRRKDLLFCSRDRFGIKPFYYAMIDGRLIFASEVKALLAISRKLAVIDPGAVSKLMRASIAGHVPEHFCRGVRRLPAAHNMIVERSGNPLLKRYWDYPATIDRSISFEAACERFRELLLDSIRLRMRSDVPVGTTLSGGVDSSTIVCLLRTFYNGEHQAFTAEFKGTEYDESVAAGHLASRLELTHHRIASLPFDFLGTLTRIVHHMDGPTQCSATVPLWNIMRSMRGRIVVALEGQGADELLGGYYRQAPAAVFDAVRAGHWRQAGRHLQWLVRHSSPLRAGLELTRAIMPSSHLTWRLLRGDESVYSGCLAKGPDKHADRGDAPIYPESIANELRRNHEGGLSTLLHYGDVISMAHSMESRLPFMDYRLVEFVFSLPGEFKIRDGSGKVLLKEAVRGLVPEFIIDNPYKLGFVVPIREWFRDQPDETIYPVLLSDRCRQRGLFEPKALERALRRHVSGRVDLSSQIFRWLTLELWCQELFD